MEDCCFFWEPVWWQPGWTGAIQVEKKLLKRLGVWTGKIVPETGRIWERMVLAQKSRRQERAVLA